MTVWEKTLINLQKGSEKFVSFAAAFSERVKAEVNIIRLRLQIDQVRDKIREQHRVIGQKLLELKENDALPRSFELFFKSEEISSALEKIGQRERDLENLVEELKGEDESLKSTQAKKEEKTA